MRRRTSFAKTALTVTGLSLLCLIAVLVGARADAADPTQLEVSVVAHGSVGGETIRIDVGGVPLATETLGTTPQSFGYLTDLVGTVEIFFETSPAAGSVTVDLITIGGLDHETEDPSTITRANGTACAEGALEVEVLSCAGSSFVWAQPVVTFLASGETPLENVACGVAPDLDPDVALFGAWVDEDDDPAVTGEVEAVEALVGAPLEIIRRFTKWDPNAIQVFPRPEDISNRDAGRLLHLSIKPVDRWADIAAARPGSELYAEAYDWGRTVCEFGAPMFLTFHHEPEGQNDRDEHGEPAEFKAAFTAMHDLFTQHAVSNVSWVWVMSWYSFFIDNTPGDLRDPDLYYPPVTDAIGFDPYNFQACSGITEWASWDFVSQPFLDWIASTTPGTPLMIPEFASEVDPNDSSRRAAWIDEATADLNTSDWDDLLGVAYFNRGPVSAGDTCDWKLDADPVALDAWRAMAESPRFNPNTTTTVSIGDSTIVEGDAGASTQVDVTVSLSSAAVGDNLSVDVASSDGTATTADDDYEAITQTVAFADGESSKVVSVSVNGDDAVEDDEMFAMSLTNPLGGISIDDSEGSVAISNDDEPNDGITISIGDGSDLEGPATATTSIDLTLSLSEPATHALSIRVTTADGTATVADADYTAIDDIVSFLPGDTSKLVTVDVIGNNVEEADELFHVVLSEAVDIQIDDGSGDVEILNDDPHLPVLSVSDVEVTEGNGGYKWAHVTFRLDERYGQQVRIDYATADGTATVDDNDYEAKTGTIVFGVNKTVRTRGIKIYGDTDVEPDEMLEVFVSNPVNATIGDGTGEITIVTNEAPTGPNSGITIGVADAVTVEGDGGSTTSVEVTVSLSDPATDALSIDVATIDASATIADGDYSAHGETLTFAIGDESKTISVSVIGDDDEEADEHFSVVLSNEADITIGNGVADVSILDDDTVAPPPAVSIADVSVNEGAGGDSTSVDLMLLLSSPATGTETVKLSTADATATAADGDYVPVSDQVIGFTAGSTSRTFTVLVTGDDVVEPDETFDVQLSDPISVTILDGDAEVTIANDDVDPGGLPVLSVSDVEVIEGNGGYKWAQVTFRLDQGSSDRVRIDFATAEGTATLADNDFQARTGTIVFGVNKTKLTRGIKIYGDHNVEDDEVLSVIISNPVFATIGDDTGVITVIDND